jgi:hypothetical protein
VKKHCRQRPLPGPSDGIRQSTDSRARHAGHTLDERSTPLTPVPAGAVRPRVRARRRRHARDRIEAGSVKHVGSMELPLPAPQLFELPQDHGAHARRRARSEAASRVIFARTCAPATLGQPIPSVGRYRAWRSRSDLGEDRTGPLLRRKIGHSTDARAGVQGACSTTRANHPVSGS